MWSFVFSRTQPCCATLRPNILRLLLESRISSFFHWCNTFSLVASLSAILFCVIVKMATTPTTRARWSRYRATWRHVSSRETQTLATHQGPARSRSRDCWRERRTRAGMDRMSLSSMEVSQEYRDRGDKRRDTAALLMDAAWKTQMQGGNIIYNYKMDWCLW